MTHLTLIPRQPVPQLIVPLTSGERFQLGVAPAARFDLIVFYRGLHCPICAKYLLELEKLLPEFEKRGIKVVAVSSDNAERADAMARKISAQKLQIGYDLSLNDARKWGLFISASRGTTSIGIEEPALFSEPGVFIVKPDGTLYYGSTQTMPFARPHFQDLIGAIDFAISNDYPARGEYVDGV